MLKYSSMFRTAILTLFLGISVLRICAQQAKTKEQGVSNAETFSERAGSLIQKEFIDVGSIKKCELKVLRITDLIRNDEAGALRFEYKSQGTYSTDTKIAVLDGDEIDGLIKSIKIIQGKIFPVIPTNYSEVTFRSRGGFEAGCFSKKDGWSTYMKLERLDSNSYVFMEKDDLSKLLTLLEQAKAKL